jgi:NodT family efflux transporter outer membrane factor (OMF) lipoprotein
MKPANVGGFALILALAGCVPAERVAPPSPIAPAAIPASRALGNPDALRAPEFPGDWSLGDPQLKALLERGMQGSPQLAQVQARIRKADAYETQVRGKSLPQVSANAQSTIGKVSSAQGLPEEFVPSGFHTNTMASLNLDWDLDLFGRNRAQLAAATSQAEAARYDSEMARQVLARGIALTYVDYAQAQAEAQIATEAAAAYAETADLIRARYRAGLTDELAAVNADTARARAEGEAVEARDALALAQFRLAAMVGEGPDFGLGLAPPAIIIPPSVPDGVGIDIIARRPDIAAAKARIEARLHDVRAAERDFYPDVSISALLGFQSLDARDLFTHAAAIPSATPAFHLPIFSGGKLLGQLNSARADRDEAIAAYDETVFNALRDAASALRNIQDSHRILEHYRSSREAAERAQQLADSRLSAQLVDKLAAIDARIATTDAKHREEIAKTRIAAAHIELFAALGGQFTQVEE